jgi:hypothetical protein
LRNIRRCWSGWLEDLEDLKMLERMRKESLTFRRLDEFLKEYPPSPC